MTSIQPFFTLSITFLETAAATSEYNADIELVPATCCVYDSDKNPSINYHCTNFPGATFKEQSQKMLEGLIRELTFKAKIYKVKYVYLDGHRGGTAVMLLNALAACHFQFKLVMRDGILFEISVLQKASQKYKTVLILRDYRPLLDSPLETLYKELVNDYEKIPHKRKLTENEVTNNPKECLRRTRRHAWALFELISTFQKMIFSEFECDTTECMSISALAMRIFTTHFYHEPLIYTNTEANDLFIRQAYFGGHSDLYRPEGKGVFMYDVNSLYVLTMRSDLPAGITNWVSHFERMKLENLFGFVEADICCPKTIKRPFLPSGTKAVSITPRVVGEEFTFQKS